MFLTFQEEIIDCTSMSVSLYVVCQPFKDGQSKNFAGIC